MGQWAPWAMVKAGSLSLRYVDLVATCQVCPPVRRDTRATFQLREGNCSRLTNPWCIDKWATGPLTCWESSVHGDLCGHCYKPASSLPRWKGVPRTTIRAPKHLRAAYGTPETTESDQGTRFTGHLVQQ